MRYPAELGKSRQADNGTRQGDATDQDATDIDSGIMGGSLTFADNAGFITSLGVFEVHRDKDCNHQGDDPADVDTK